MMCCDIEASTPFCPYCGSKLVEEHSMRGLIGQLRSTLATKRSNLDRMVDGTHQHCRGGVIDVKHIKSEQRAIKKYEAWVELLEAIVASQ
jgi:hypothetical protein